MLAGQNGARGRIRTCTGDALDVVSLLLDYASEMDGASCRCCPGLTFLQRKPAGCRKEALNNGEHRLMRLAATPNNCVRAVRVEDLCDDRSPIPS